MMFSADGTEPEPPLNNTPGLLHPIDEETSLILNNYHVYVSTYTHTPFINWT